MNEGKKELEMRKHHLFGMAGLFSLLFFALLIMPVLADTDNMTIMLGTVSSAGTIVTDQGETYAIAKTDMGQELLKNDGKKAIVTGTVEEGGGKKTLSVSSYQMVEKSGPGESEKSDD